MSAELSGGLGVGQVVEARRQARELLDEQNVRTERRMAEQRRVESLLAAEEMRHLDTLTRCKEDKVSPPRDLQRG